MMRTTYRLAAGLTAALLLASACSGDGNVTANPGGGPAENSAGNSAGNGAAGSGAGAADTVGDNGTPANPPATPAHPVNILFVGNSYTFARVDPAMTYNTASVADMTAAFNAANPDGTNSYPVGSGLPPAPCVAQGVGCFEPHPWGGVPGIFKKLTDEAGLNYIVSLSTRNAASLRGHFLNIANATWDLRGNIASQKWDVVIVQGQSDEPLPAGKAKNANFPQFDTYAKLIAEYVQTGTIGTLDANGQTTEAQIFGSLANCMAATSASPAGPGLSRTSCNTVRTIPVNVNANPNARIYLEQMWARPDMVEAHRCTTPDLSTMDGSPIVDPTCSNGANGSAVTGMNTLYYTSEPSTAANLNDITNDMKSAVNRVVAESGRYAGIVPVGDAFQRAVNTGVVKASGFYDASGVYTVSPTQMELWWKDRTHASVYGSYLKALVLYGRLTGRDPAAFGAGEQAAKDLGISAANALTLQKVASDTLQAQGYLTQ